jgi:3'(2'), 5'-bisphosphate nucleotidase
VTAAGGAVTTPAGAPLRYGGWRHGFAVPGFIAWGDPTRQISALPG